MGTKTGGKAFPSGAEGYTDYANGAQWMSEKRAVQEGMDLRDWFAGQIAAGLVSEGGWRPETVATTAYAFADAMLAEREK